MKDNEGGVIELADGRRLGYGDYGSSDGLPLLALHGTPGSRVMLRPGSEIAAEKGVRLIAPDRPGYGRSSSCPGYCLSDWVGDMDALCVHLGIKRAMVFGVSGGGPFATAVAALRPGLVESLALVSPVGLMDDELRAHLPFIQRMYFSLLPRGPRVLNALLGVMRLAFFMSPSLSLSAIFLHLGSEDRKILGKPANRQSVIEMVRDGTEPGVQGIVDDLRLFSSDWQLPLQHITAPVLVWQGDDDKQVPEAAALALAEVIPTAALQPLPGQGHFWVYEHFDTVLDWLLAHRAVSDQR